MLHRGGDVFQFLPFIAPHQKHADSNPVLLRQLHGAPHLLDRDPPLHGVQDSLAAALRADPDAMATQLAQGLHRGLRLQPVRAGDGLEGQMQAPLVELLRVALQPGVTDREDIVGVPELVGIIVRDYPAHLFGYPLRTAPAV